MNNLIMDFAAIASKYIGGLETRKVQPLPEEIDGLKAFDHPLQMQPIPPEEVLAEMDTIGSPGTIASTGGRYFGFVVGGSLPAAMAANLLAGVWDQNSAFRTLSPTSAVLEEVASRWLLSQLGLPSQAAVGFVTGATMANFTALAAARHAVLSQQGWNCESQGLFGAPPIIVVVGEEVHVSVLKALSMLGLGRDRILRVPVDDQGRMRPDRIPSLSAPAIICLQAGNVNTGAFDPAEEICGIAKRSGAWVHVDGAFGLWAKTSSEFDHLTRGIEQADSWATDAHKWLNVPYDSGIVFVRQEEHLKAAMAASAAYLIQGAGREPYHFTPELSRRGRGIEVWAALRSLGQNGLVDLVDRTCGYASRFADGLRTAGFQILNDIVLNQVLVSFGEPELTRRITLRIQQEGTCWCGGTEWQGQVAMRISVSGWATTPDDIEKCLHAILDIASDEKAK